MNDAALKYTIEENKKTIAGSLTGGNNDLIPVVAVLEAIDRLSGIARKQAFGCYSLEFALDGVVYVGFPKLNRELIAAAPAVGLKLVDRNGAVL